MYFNQCGEHMRVNRWILLQISNRNRSRNFYEAELGSNILIFKTYINSLNRYWQPIKRIGTREGIIKVKLKSKFALFLYKTRQVISRLA